MATSFTANPETGQFHLLHCARPGALWGAPRAARSWRKLMIIFQDPSGFSGIRPDVHKFDEVCRMARKRTSDTMSGAVAMFQGASVGAPDAPASLRADAVVYWDSIVSARSSSEWDALGLILAGQAAAAMADIAEAQRTLDAEGLFVDTASGGLKAHPAGAVLDSATKRLLSLLRALGMSASDPRDSAGRDGAFRKARRVVADLDGDDLLAH